MIIFVFGSKNLLIMDNKYIQSYIINRPRRSKRGLTVCKNGRFYLRTQLIRLLELHAGDGIVFVHADGQVYIIKSSTLPNPIVLSGRDGQLHGNSVDTAKHLFLFIDGMAKDSREVDLIVDDKAVDLSFEGEKYKAVAIVTRTDSGHCR